MAKCNSHAQTPPPPQAANPQVFCSAGVGIHENDVRVIYDTATYGRKTNDRYDSRCIEKTWHEKMNQGVILYDKSKFRLHEARHDPDTNVVTLELGLTSYKDFIGTNCAPYGKELMMTGRSVSTGELARGFEYLANPLGVGALVETADSKIVLLMRSNLCAESPGLMDLPGGHPEPDEVKSIGELDACDDKAIVHEIFHSILREVRDEVNIPEENLSEPILLGICFNELTLYRPSAEFFIKCSLTSSEVLSKYEQTHAEKEESTHLIFIDATTFKEMKKERNIAMLDRFTPSVKGAVELFSAYSP